MTIDDGELFSRRMAQAFLDCQELGERYVPTAWPLGSGNWCVVDGWMETIVERGHSFENALSRAEELSRMFKETTERTHECR
jgi:hypothetical protein